MRRFLIGSLVALVLAWSGSVAWACCDTPPCCEGPTCCANPFPDAYPITPTGFAITVQFGESVATLTWDAYPCHEHWELRLDVADIDYYPNYGIYAFVSEPWEPLVSLETTVVTYGLGPVAVPVPVYGPFVPAKVYRLCGVNTQTGQEACTPRAVGVYRQQIPWLLG